MRRSDAPAQMVCPPSSVRRNVGDPPAHDAVATQRQMFEIEWIEEAAQNAHVKSNSHRQGVFMRERHMRLSPSARSLELAACLGDAGEQQRCVPRGARRSPPSCKSSLAIDTCMHVVHTRVRMRGDCRWIRLKYRCQRVCVQLKGQVMMQAAGSCSSVSFFLPRLSSPLTAFTSAQLGPARRPRAAPRRTAAARLIRHPSRRRTTTTNRLRRRR